MSSLSAKTVTFGYAPTTFPRDPVLFNQYAEHTLIGQILKPLVETDLNGNIVSGVADNWEFSKDEKSITFNLGNLKFSDGRDISGEDVKYTLERNINLGSQSKEYLNSIKNIEATSKKVILFLKERDHTLIKALSRDQLGILPKDWKFDPTSSQPFTSSGDYNLERKKDGKWYLIKNIPVESLQLSYELLFYKDETFEIPNILPDLALFINSNDLEKLKKLDLKKNYIEKSVPSFIQNLFWVTKDGKLYKDIKTRNYFRLAFEEGLQEYFKKNNSLPATGIIPVGISGSLESRVPVSKENLKAPKNNSFFELTFLYMAGSHEKLIRSTELQNTLKKYQIKINFIPYILSDNIPEKIKNADIVATTFAGGFNDPMGFIGILYKVFGITFDEYLPKEIKPYYLDAINESDWKKRPQLFMQLNQKIMASSLCIAGWRPKMFSFSNPSIEENSQLYRYTPRLINYSSKFEK